MNQENNNIKKTTKLSENDMQYKERTPKTCRLYTSDVNFLEKHGYIISDVMRNLLHNFVLSLKTENQNKKTQILLFNLVYLIIGVFLAFITQYQTVDVIRWSISLLSLFLVIIGSHAIYIKLKELKI